MVLVGERRAEERHDPVAHHLVDGALVAVDRLHHALEHRVEDLARLLGVAVGEQLHRALEVGEEDRDLLALAFQRGLGGEDLLGEVLGGVGLSGDANGVPAAAATGWAQAGQNLAVAESRPRHSSSMSGQRRRALFAEPRPLRILVLAPGTLHSTLTSQVGDGQNGEMNLAPGHSKGNNGLDDTGPESCPRAPD